VFPKPTLIFDFDGTIADTLPLLLALTNRLAPEYGYRQVEEADINILRDLHAREVIRWLRIPWYQLPRLAHRFRAELRLQMPQVAPIAAVPTALDDLSLHFSLGIVTTNSVANVRAFLSIHRISHFAFVYPSRRLLGKRRTLRRVLRERRLVANHTLYIGDEVRDVEAAQSCGLDALAVSWGANNAVRLQRANPFSVVHRPDTLPEAVRAWSRAKGTTFG
jgi:phosphoglycolate phosphatase-like HAD superfamily hydrolase